jgi:nicotinate-nucleotide adenylyltransferase
MKIGILGGSFNPPHIGHLILAQEALEAAGLDKVFFIPSNISPHKNNNLVDALKRFKMVQLMISGDKHFQALDVEIKRPGISFTIDTIRNLKTLYPGDDFHLIIGSDLADSFLTWKDYRRIKKEVKIIVAYRQKYPFERRRYLLPIKITQVALSSSQVRSRIKKGRSIHYLVPEKVAEYIKRHRLYR